MKEESTGKSIISKIETNVKPIQKKATNKKLFQIESPILFEIGLNFMVYLDYVEDKICNNFIPELRIIETTQRLVSKSYPFKSDLLIKLPAGQIKEIVVMKDLF